MWLKERSRVCRKGRVGREVMWVMRLSCSFRCSRCGSHGVAETPLILHPHKRASTIQNLEAKQNHCLAGHWYGSTSACIVFNMTCDEQTCAIMFHMMVTVAGTKAVTIIGFE